MPKARNLKALPTLNAVRPENFSEIAFENSWDPILILDGEFKVVAMNGAAEELVGFVRSEILGDSIFRLKATKHTGRSRSIEPELFDLGGTVEDVLIERKDHGVRVVDFSSRRVEKQGVLNYVLLFRDHTGRKQMERDLIIKHQELKAAYIELEKKNHELKASQETLIQAGKMAALGELAAGIAHELNQPLMSIRGYAQELEAILKPVITGLPVETEVTLSTREIISQADKMAKIISHLRTFTRRSTEDMEVVDVRGPIEEALKMLDRQFKSRGITVERDFADDVPQVYANSLQLEQIFINLATNARDAIEQMGRGSGSIRISTRKVGQFAEVRFTDDGVGMNDRTKQKAFNPFFTTKEVGKGMGLGLSLSYGMISKVQGSIRIESEVGRGTTFIIQLPRDFRELG